MTGSARGAGRRPAVRPRQVRRRRRSRCSPRLDVRPVARCRAATGPGRATPGRGAPGAGPRAIINTDNGLDAGLGESGATFRVVAVDGTDVHGRRRSTGRAGARGCRWPRRPRGQCPRPAAGSSRAGRRASVLGSGGSSAASTRRRASGRPADLWHACCRRRSTPPPRPDGRLQLPIGRRPGFVDGAPRRAVDDQRPPCSRTCRCSWSPRATSSPMHINNHSRRGRTRCTCTATTWWCSPATGCARPAARGGPTRSRSTTATDYERRLRGRQPGDLARPLPQPAHATDGLIAHLMYEGVTTTFRLGRDTANSPE